MRYTIDSIVTCLYYLWVYRVYKANNTQVVLAMAHNPASPYVGRAKSTARSVPWLVGSRWSPHPRALARQADSPYLTSADRAQRLYCVSFHCVIQRYSNGKTCLP